MIDKKLLFKILRESREAVRYGRFELEVAARRMNQYVHQRRGKPESFDLMERDWDTAIILDACRFDYFRDENPFSAGELSKKTAPGGASQEFIREMFLGRELHDTVYVTGNPFVSLLQPRTFHDLIVDDAWDIGNSQAPPDKLTEAAIEAHDVYPNKRIVVHYMQPHFPIHHPEYKFINESISWRHGQFWPVSATRQEVRDGYRANLRYVLSHVENLVDRITGKTIVTADHGELLGERTQPIPLRTYNHHEGLYVTELLNVPWFELDFEDRREIEPEPPKNDQEVSEEDRRERLVALGYM